MKTMLDVLAGGLALYASACLYLRADALKPCRADYPDAPPWPRWSLFLLSLVFAAYALPVIMGRYEATRTETVLIAAVAFAAHVLWRNVRRQSADRPDGVTPPGAGARFRR